MEKIAILYICTGKYNQFFAGFYDSCERFFLRGIASLNYFVFTDDLNLSSAKNVCLIKKDCQGFPLDSLFRFDMFLEIEAELKKFDYIFFFNANMLFLEPVGREVLPEKEKLVAVLHPGYYNKPAFLYPYDRNKKSTAYISPRKESYKYYMGSLNGGKAEDYLELIRECSRNIHIDYDSRYVAMVHDESHLNKYLLEHQCLAISPAYAYPEDWRLPFEAKILIRDKVKIDSYFNKGRDYSFRGRVKKFLGILWRSIEWYI